LIRHQHQQRVSRGEAEPFILPPMATRETRLQRGRRRGQTVARELVRQLHDGRVVAGLSQRALAAELGCSQSEVSRFEGTRRLETISLVRVAEIASLLGLELSVGLHPIGEAIRDKGHQALIGRFRAQLSDAYIARAEAPLPIPGDLRSWDLVLRADGQLIGVEAETRIRDVQALVRRVRGRERDGGVDEIVLVLSASRTNARLVGELRSALGERYATPPRVLLRTLRAGSPLPTSGVVLL
jgi:transcriptional regulator with XRE-family HTH domain